MTLVTGATGNAGSEVVRALQARGQAVRAFVRDPERARAKLGDDVELAAGDFADGSSLRAALRGMSSMVLSCADDPRRVEWERSAIDMAGAAGVQLIVKLSTLAAEPGAPVAFWDWHGRVEEYLRSAPVASVVLQSSTYMSNLLAAAPQVANEGRLCAPAGEARIAMIDPRDVGEAAASVLGEPGHDGETYVITGAEAITYAQAAAHLSAATGYGVEYVDVPDEVARQALLARGLPESVADEVIKVFELLRAGVASRPTDTVEVLTGSPPRRFADFARDHASLFEPATVAAVP